MFDALEQRLLLTQLSVLGGPNRDQMLIYYYGTAGAGLNVGVLNSGKHTLTVKVDEVSYTLNPGVIVSSEAIKPGGVTTIRPIDLGAGDDSVSTDPRINIRMTLNGGSGNDALYSGTGDDYLDGGTGNDILDGGSLGRDMLRGGAGSDYLNGHAGNDLLEGDGGFTATSATPTSNDTLVGEAGFDTLTGGLGADLLQGGVDGDMLSGNDGDDILAGGLGTDTLTGGLGQDEATYADHDSGGVVLSIDAVANDGSPGENDSIATDIERLSGSPGDDLMTAGKGAATLDGAGGDDTLIGGDSNDVLILSGLSTGGQASGMGGDDLFVNQNGRPDTVDGGDGFDSVQDDDVTITEPGIQNDTFVDVEFVYDAFGNNGNGTAALVSDAANARVSSPVVTRGVSVDSKNVLRVRGMDNAVGDKIYLSQTTVIENGKRVSRINVEVNGTGFGPYNVSGLRAITVEAGNGNDIVQLATAKGKDRLSFPVRVSGGNGNDTITGGTGNDQLAGENGSDSVDGGAGNDIVSGDFVVLVNETAPTDSFKADGNDTVIGGAGSTDIVSYTNRKDAVRIDLTKSTSVSGSIKAGEKDQLRGVEYVVGGQVADNLTGSNVNDVLFGGDSDDRITGGGGADRFKGGFGSDTLVPDAGADDLDSGGDDGVADSIIGSLDKNGLTPRSGKGVLLTGSFNRQDYFTLSKRNYGQEE